MEPSAKITVSMRKEDVERQWHLIDAADKTVGRLAAQVATLLRGKHKPWFTPHVDCGDFVIVINAEKVKTTGKRPAQKVYFHHSMYPGGEKYLKFKEALAKKPEFIIEHAVKGMLPKNRLGRKIIKKLKVYSGTEHPHAAQQPEAFQLRYGA
ncbi:MAG: large subunit ribosomal protein [Bacteroidota bacterium]|nr:large subunit ribosomal protein [Bacteroidota bacterium]